MAYVVRLVEFSAQYELRRLNNLQDSCADDSVRLISYPNLYQTRQQLRNSNRDGPRLLWLIFASVFSVRLKLTLLGGRGANFNPRIRSEKEKVPWGSVWATPPPHHCTHCMTNALLALATDAQRVERLTLFRGFKSELSPPGRRFICKTLVGTHIWGT